MANWRIKEVTYHPGTKDEYKKYYVEKRFLGFLWWSDPYEDGLYSDGECDTFEEAIRLINNTLIKKSTRIVWTNDNGGNTDFTYQIQ